MVVSVAATSGWEFLRSRAKLFAGPLWVARILRGFHDRHWFATWLAARIAAVALLAHWYDSNVFVDAALRLSSQQGVYAYGPIWRISSFGNEGYYAYPPVYAYVLALSGLLYGLAPVGPLLLKAIIKIFLLCFDVAVFLVLSRVSKSAARAYWTLWFVPLLAIAQMQPDVLVGLLVLAAFLSTKQGRHEVSGLLLGLGAAVKFLPVLVVPFLVVHFARQKNMRAAATYLVYPVLAFGASWLPYVALYPDSASFADVLAYHAGRIGGGLNAWQSVHLISFGLGEFNGLVAPTFDLVGFRESLIGLLPLYHALGGGILLFCLVWYARGARDTATVEVAYLLPLLAFLFVGAVINEQYLMVVVPVAVVAALDLLRRLYVPLSIYVILAGSPWRFLPTEIAGDSLFWLYSPSGPNHIVLSAVVLFAGMAGLWFHFALGRQIALTIVSRKKAKSWLAQKARVLMPYGLAIILTGMSIATLFIVTLGGGNCRLTVSVLSLDDPGGLGAISHMAVGVRNLGAVRTDVAFSVLVEGMSIETLWSPPNQSAWIEAFESRLFDVVPMAGENAIPFGSTFYLKVYAESFNQVCTTAPVVAPSNASRSA